MGRGGGEERQDTTAQNSASRSTNIIFAKIVLLRYPLAIWQNQWGKQKHQPQSPYIVWRYESASVERVEQFRMFRFITFNCTRKDCSMWRLMFEKQCFHSFYIIMRYIVEHSSKIT